MRFPRSVPLIRPTLKAKQKQASNSWLKPYLLCSHTSLPKNASTPQSLLRVDVRRNCDADLLNPLESVSEISLLPLKSARIRIPTDFKLILTFKPCYLSINKKIPQDTKSRITIDNKKLLCTTYIKNKVIIHGGNLESLETIWKCAIHYAPVRTVDLRKNCAYALTDFGMLISSHSSRHIANLRHQKNSILLRTSYIKRYYITDGAHAQTIEIFHWTNPTIWIILKSRPAGHTDDDSVGPGQLRHSQTRRSTTSMMKSRRRSSLMRKSAATATRKTSRLSTESSSPLVSWLSLLTAITKLTTILIKLSQTLRTSAMRSQNLWMLDVRSSSLTKNLRMSLFTDV